MKAGKKARTKLNARMSGMVATHNAIKNDQRVNPKMRQNVEGAYRMPGSLNLNKNK